MVAVNHTKSRVTAPPALWATIATDSASEDITKLSQTYVACEVAEERPTIGFLTPLMVR